VHKRAMGAGASYYLNDHNASMEGPDDAPLGCRLVTNWSTTDADVDGFIDLLKA